MIKINNNAHTNDSIGDNNNNNKWHFIISNHFFLLCFTRASVWSFKVVLFIALFIARLLLLTLDAPLLLVQLMLCYGYDRALGYSTFC